MQTHLLRYGALAVVLMSLAACLPQEGGLAQGPSPAAPEGAPLCAPGVYAGLIGEPAAAASAVPEPKRLLGPGEKRTMDYVPARTNIEVDAAGVITRVFCG